MKKTNDDKLSSKIVDGIAYAVLPFAMILGMIFGAISGLWCKLFNS